MTASRATGHLRSGWQHGLGANEAALITPVWPDPVMRSYAVSHASRPGASGLTFYDDDVTEFFSPHAKGKSVMFLVALGKLAKRKHNVS